MCRSKGAPGGWSFLSRRPTGRRCASCLPDTEWNVPQRGTALRWLELADGNARHLLESLRIESFETEERAEDPVYALGRDLGLSVVPRSLICVDISHNQGRDTVGSLVWFEAGRPKKSEYRKFKIQGAGQQDDFAAIQEVLTRYLTRRRDEQLPMPDLIVIDGGKGQLSAALEAAAALGLGQIPMISLAKREEEVFLPGRSESLRLSAQEPLAPPAAAGPGRGPSLRAGVQPEPADPAHDHVGAAQHPRRRARRAAAPAGALRQPGGGEIGLGLRARDGPGVLDPAGGARCSSTSTSEGRGFAIGAGLGHILKSMSDGHFAILDPAAGISGDMVLGALVAAGAPPEWLRGLPARLGFPEVTVDVRDGGPLRASGDQGQRHPPRRPPRSCPARPSSRTRITQHDHRLTLTTRQRRAPPHRRPDRPNRSRAAFRLGPRARRPRLPPARRGRGQDPRRPGGAGRAARGRRRRCRWWTSSGRWRGSSSWA